ncbi:MAG: polysaccharide biosynthesis/export family protein [Acidobacteria bacterium]|nr:polysaccharide biosynthesis/export family protein [Acidobacteriota bacterium]
MSKSAKSIVAVVLMSFAIPCAVLAQANSKPAKSPKPADATDSQLATGPVDDSYVIGAEDVLTINVWKEIELTKTLPVRNDGKISMPLLNDVQAAGLTPMQLGTLITERLKKFIGDPQVTVIVNQINSRKIYITGEMSRTGAYPLSPGMTVMQAIASAGGFSQYANPSKTYILRSENGKKVKYPFNYKAVLKGNNPEQDILLKPGDVIVVP